jgi:hypothetical protein
LQGQASPQRPNSEYDERKKNWRRCECPIFVSGTIGKDFRRQNTGRWQWVDAQTVAGEIERAGKWEGTSAPIPVPEPPEPSTQVRVTLERAINAFTAEFEEHAALNTQKKYRLLLAKLRAFGDGRGYVMLDQWTPLDVREMRSSWEVAPNCGQGHEHGQGFFEFCLANEWIPRNPARLVKNQRTRDSADRRNEQKLPFSDKELKRMYEASKPGMESRKSSGRVRSTIGALRATTLATTRNGLDRILLTLFLFPFTRVCGYLTWLHSMSIA